jgi:hypothetical protein
VDRAARADKKVSAMTKLIAGIVLGAIATIIAALCIYRYERQRETRREILEAAGAINTVADYSSSAGFVAADLAARQKLNALDAQDLPDADRKTLTCMVVYLSSIESMNSATDLETATLREGIADKAAAQMDVCMAPYTKH